MSASTIRPPGPLPVTCLSSIPCCAAIRFATGLARNGPTAGEFWLLADETLAGIRLSDGGLRFVAGGAGFPSPGVEPLHNFTRRVFPTAAPGGKMPSPWAGNLKKVFLLVIFSTAPPQVTPDTGARNQS